MCDAVRVSNTVSMCRPGHCPGGPRGDLDLAFQPSFPSLVFLRKTFSFVYVHGSFLLFSLLSSFRVYSTSRFKGLSLRV